MQSSGFKTSKIIDHHISKIESNIVDRLNCKSSSNTDDQLRQIYQMEINNLKQREMFQVDLLVYLRAKEGKSIEEISLNDSGLSHKFKLPCVLICEATFGNHDSRVFDKLCRASISSAYVKNQFEELFFVGRESVLRPDRFYTYFLLSTSSYWATGLQSLSNLSRIIFDNNSELKELLGWDQAKSAIIKSSFPHIVSKDGKRMFNFEEELHTLQNECPIVHFHIDSRSLPDNKTIAYKEIANFLDRKIKSHVRDEVSFLEKKIDDVEKKLESKIDKISKTLDKLVKQGERKHQNKRSSGSSKKQKSNLSENSNDHFKKKTKTRK
jgi:hypothetical protein